MACTLILYTIIRDIAIVLIHRDTGQNALYLNFNIISSLTDVSHRLLLLNTKAILISLRQLKCQITPRTLLSLSLENNPSYIYIVLEGIREVCLNINISSKPLHARCPFCVPVVYQNIPIICIILELFSSKRKHTLASSRNCNLV